MKLLSALALLPVCAACTFEDGRGFATLESASLSVRVKPGSARDLGNDTVLTDLGYAVRVIELGVDVEHLELYPATEAAGAGAPPCDDDHCHGSEGLGEDAAQDADGATSDLEPLAVVEFEQHVSALDDSTLSAASVLPSRELPRARLAAATLALGGVRMRAVVRHEPDLGKSAPLELVLPAPTLRDAVGLAIDRDAPERIRVAGSWVLQGTLFDGIDFESTLLSQGLISDDPQQPEATRFIANLAAQPFTVELLAD